jgi:hypothetical protein
VLLHLHFPAICFSQISFSNILLNERKSAKENFTSNLSEHIIHAETRGENLDMKTKEKADLLEGKYRLNTVL